MSDEHNDWLWDGSGEPDAFESSLERSLEGLRYSHPPPQQHPQSQQPRTRWPLVIGLAAAAALLIAVLANREEPTISPFEPWAIVAEGACPDDDCLLEPGEWIEPAQPVDLTVADIGQMTIEPNSRLRLVHTRENEHRLELAAGAVEAYVIAPPRVLIVDTPAVTAVDLGCAYRMSVDEEETTTLDVTSGWVAMETPAREVFVVAGASASTPAGKAPSTPIFRDAEPAFKDAIAALDEDPKDRRALIRAIQTARKEDTLSLWHLLPMVPKKGRAQILEVVFEIDPPLRDQIAEDKILDADPAELERLKEELIFLWGFRG